jgi:hypothetical protein
VKKSHNPIKVVSYSTENCQIFLGAMVYSIDVSVAAFGALKTLCSTSAKIALE